MAHEKEKLAEARHFYTQMLKEVGDREKFTYNLSAFLSSARSVLQYALEEAKTKKGGQQWYDNHVTASPVLSFFRDKRDFNIHIGPITPTQYSELIVHCTVHAIVSTSLAHLHGNGKILYQSPPEIPEPRAEATKVESPGGGETYYRFVDWQGSEDVMTLCEEYFDESQRIVEDGIQNGFLTQ